MGEMLLYLGCMVYNRFPGYEISAKAVLEKLGIRARDMQRFACCSSTLLPSFSGEWVHLASYNLALAEEAGLDVVTLCGTCTATLRRANHLLSRDENLIQEVNQRLNELDMSYSGKTGVKHILQVVAERRERLSKEIERRPGLKVALQHPCNIFRPGYLAGFDIPLKPRKMRELLELAGIEVVSYPREYQCCGSTLTLAREELGARAGGEKLLSAQRAGAEFIAVACGNCAYLFDRKLEEIKELEPGARVKTIFFTQLLALAMGLEDTAALGIRGVEIE